MARAVWQNLVASLPAPQRAALDSIKIVVRESDIAFVEYQASVSGTEFPVITIDDACFSAGTAGYDFPNASGMSARVNLPRLLTALPHKCWLVLPPGAETSMYAPADLAFDRIVAEDELTSADTAGEITRVRESDISPTFTVDYAVLAAIGAIKPESEWGFDTVKYLEGKVPVDKLAMQTSGSIAELERLLGVRDSTCVLDVGSGTLSMFRALLPTLAKNSKAIRYLCIEMDPKLIAAAGDILMAEGYTRTGAAQDCYNGTAEGGVPVLVEMLNCDFTKISPAELPATPDLIVACLFADLLPPKLLAAQLARLAPSGLAYMPITFAGETTFEHQFAGTNTVPSDAVVASCYHAALAADQGQFLELPLLVAALSSNAGEVKICKESPWQISATEHPYMWESMLYFIGILTSKRLFPVWNLSAWVQEVRTSKPNILVKNVDIICRLPPVTSLTTETTYLSFTAPRTVEVCGRSVCLDRGSVDAATKVLLKSRSSMISSGTELK